MARALAHVALGANLGDRLAALRDAVAALGALGAVVARSSVWESAPAGPGAGGPEYHDAVVALATPLDPEPLLDELHAIEARHGRRRPSPPNAPRTLDLDLLLVGDRVLRGPRLVLPHPRLHQRRFVLAPLAEIAPHAVHPLLHRTIAELLAALPPGDPARRLDDPL